MQFQIALNDMLKLSLSSIESFPNKLLGSQFTRLHFCHKVSINLAGIFRHKDKTKIQQVLSTGGMMQLCLLTEMNFVQPPTKALLDECLLILFFTLAFPRKYTSFPRN